jgi:DNA-binding ferritin-like protein
MDSKKLINRWASSQDINTQLIISENLIDGLLGTKIAADNMDEEACKILSAYVAFTRAIYILHQQNHWQAQSYGDHLLFQRLYEDSQTLADDAAERVMGLCGEVVFEGEESIAKKFEPKIPTLTSLLEASLEIENAFQDVTQNTYDALKAKDMLTLGLDDLIMSQAAMGEVHIYLLQQALKGLNMNSVKDNAKEILEKAEALEPILVSTAKKHKPEYKPKDIIDYIEAALKVRPYEEVLDYIKGLETNIIDQVFGILMKSNPTLLKKIYVSSVAPKQEVEVVTISPNISPSIESVGHMEHMEHIL